MCFCFLKVNALHFLWKPLPLSLVYLLTIERSCGGHMHYCSDEYSARFLLGILFRVGAPLCFNCSSNKLSNCPLCQPQFPSLTWNMELKLCTWKGSLLRVNKINPSQPGVSRPRRESRGFGHIHKEEWKLQHYLKLWDSSFQDSSCFICCHLY